MPALHLAQLESATLGDTGPCLALSLPICKMWAQPEAL